jgi:hypothetical protein
MPHIRCSPSEARQFARIVNARALAGGLTATSDPIEAPAQYDAERRPVMNDITRRNRGFGPEAAMQLVEERAPHGFVRIGDVISHENSIPSPARLPQPRVLMS